MPHKVLCTHRPCRVLYLPIFSLIPHESCVKPYRSGPNCMWPSGEDCFCSRSCVSSCIVAINFDTVLQRSMRLLRTIRDLSCESQVQTRSRLARSASASGHDPASAMIKHMMQRFALASGKSATFRATCDSCRKQPFRRLTSFFVAQHTRQVTYRPFTSTPDTHYAALLIYHLCTIVAAAPTLSSCHRLLPIIICHPRRTGDA